MGSCGSLFFFSQYWLLFVLKQEFYCGDFNKLYCAEYEEKHESHISAFETGRCCCSH